MAEFFGISPALIDSHPWPQWLAHDPLQHQTDYSWTPLGALEALIETVGSDMHRPNDVPRRTFVLSSAAMASALLSWLTTDPTAAGQLASGRRIGETAVASIERRVRELRATDDGDGGGTLISDATAALAVVTDILSNRNHTLAHARRLFAAAADLARMRAWATFDVHGRCDDRAFRSALHAAHSADDASLGAHVLTFWAAASYNCGRPAEAEALASTALTAVRGKTAPRVQALVSARRARARSHIGHAGCWDDLDNAWRLLENAEQDPDGEPDWAYWFDRTEFYGCSASIQLSMGRPDQAEATFAEASRTFNGATVRTHAVYLVRQADAQWRQGHVDEACSTAHKALDFTAEISSQRTSAPLRELAAAMRTHGSDPAVGQLRERIAHFT